jgi:uncharacterized iron-regulated membrane protein
MALLRKWHRWLGLVLLLPLVLQGVTGTVLTVAAAWPDGTGASCPTCSANAVLAAAGAVAPEGFRPRAYRPGQPATVMLAPAGRGPGATVRIDPVGLTPIGPVSAQGGVVQTMHRLHENLLIPAYAGRSILGWEGVGLVLLVVVGIPLWWPRPGEARAAFLPAPRARGIRFHRRLHGAIGIWLLPLMLLTAVTGIPLSFPQTTHRLLGLPPGGPPQRASGTSAGPVDLDRAIGLAITAVPDAALRLAFLPAGQGDPLRLFLAPAGDRSAAATTQINLSGDGTRLLTVQRFADLPMAERVLRVMRDLHEGIWWGATGLVLTALAGLALPIFAVTGAAMWWLRRCNRLRAASRQAALQAAD